MLTKVLARALAPDVTVNAIAPGAVLVPEEYDDGGARASRPDHAAPAARRPGRRRRRAALSARGRRLRDRRGPGGRWRTTSPIGSRSATSSSSAAAATAPSMPGSSLRARERGKAELAPADRGRPDPACRVARELGSARPLRARRRGVGSVLRPSTSPAAPPARRPARRDRSVPAHAAPHVRMAGPAGAGALARPAVEIRPLADRAGDAVRRAAPGRHPLRVLRRLALPHALHRAGHLPRDPGAPDLGDGRRHGAACRGGSGASRPPVPCCSSAGIGCTGSACSTCARSWRATRWSRRRGRAGAVDVLVGTISALPRGGRACCIWASSALAPSGTRWLVRSRRRNPGCSIFERIIPGTV